MAGNPINLLSTGKDSIATDSAQGITEIDESKSGEPWVQGLTEGEYCDLCVEERLNALVAIIGVANEGNVIRAVLEVNILHLISVVLIRLNNNSLEARK